MDREVWPHTIPAVRSVAQHGRTFDRPGTFLVGENGTGKSTLVGRSSSDVGSPRAPEGGAAKGVLEFVRGAGVPSHGARAAAELSHGGAFVEVLAGRFAQPAVLDARPFHITAIPGAQILALSDRANREAQ